MKIYGLNITYDDDLETSNYGIANHEEMMSLIYSCIGNYLRQIDLPWFNSWVGFSPVRYNRYKSNTNMKLHCDHINTVFDGTIRGIPTLTILGLLNDEFKGGEFTLFDQEEDVIPLEKGDVIMFPSNFQYPHKVNSVTNGVRYSFVSWAY
jgi:predicted 2-oxoglutarate/Fe(II)-dependent dioxygenase YbiX